MNIDNIVTQNTLIGPARLQVLINAVDATRTIEGHICEVGVYKGGSARLFCLNTSENIFLVDTFEGLPTECDKDNAHKAGDFNDTSIDHVKNTLTGLTNYTIIQQTFPHGDTSQLDNLKFKVVHIDVDLYTCVKECLEYFYPKMIIGGYIILDDYGAPSCLGAKLAVDEFMKDKTESIQVGAECSVLIIKK